MYERRSPPQSLWGLLGVHLPVLCGYSLLDRGPVYTAHGPGKNKATGEVLGSALRALCLLIRRLKQNSASVKALVAEYAALVFFLRLKNMVTASASLRQLTVPFHVAPEVWVVPRFRFLCLDLTYTHPSALSTESTGRRWPALHSSQDEEVWKAIDEAVTGGMIIRAWIPQA